jgi:hypothetical protein
MPNDHANANPVPNERSAPVTPDEKEAAAKPHVPPHVPQHDPSTKAPGTPGKLEPTK